VINDCLGVAKCEKTMWEIEYPGGSKDKLGERFGGWRERLRKIFGVHTRRELGEELQGPRRRNRSEMFDVLK